MAVRCIHVPAGCYRCHQNQKDRHAIDENAFVEKLFPEEVEALRSLPLPLHVLRELWIRTQNERAWRRFYTTQRLRLSSLLLKTTEIPTSTRRSGVMHPSGSISPCHLKRGMNADKPVKGPVWQTDEVEILLSKNGVHAHRKY